MDSFHRNPSHFPPYHEEAIPYSSHSLHKLVQSPLEPYSVRISKARLLYDCLDSLGFKFAELGRFFSRVENPYLDTNYGDFSHIKLIMSA